MGWGIVMILLLHVLCAGFGSVLVSGTIKKLKNLWVKPIAFKNLIGGASKFLCFLQDGVI